MCNFMFIFVNKQLWKAQVLPYLKCFTWTLKSIFSSCISLVVHLLTFVSRCRRRPKSEQMFTVESSVLQIFTFLIFQFCYLQPKLFHRMKSISFLCIQTKCPGKSCHPAGSPACVFGSLLCRVQGHQLVKGCIMQWTVLNLQKTEVMKTKKTSLLAMSGTLYYLLCCSLNTNIFLYIFNSYSDGQIETNSPHLAFQQKYLAPWEKLNIPLLHFTS